MQISSQTFTHLLIQLFTQISCKYSLKYLSFNDTAASAQSNHLTKIHLQKYSETYTQLLLQIITQISTEIFTQILIQIFSKMT